MTCVSRVQAHFMGANAIPWRVYQPMLRRLGELDVQVECTDTFREIEGQQDWRKMVAKLCDDVEESRKRAGGGHVVGIGHSFGAAMMMCASAQRPQIFSKVFLYDPPMFRPWRRFLFAAGMAYFPNLSGRYLLTKNLFRSMHPESLEAFIQHALCDSVGGGVELIFPGENEARIFETAPQDVQFLSKMRMGLYDRTTAPAGWLVYSDMHTLATKADVAALARQLSPPLEIVSSPHSHYFPLDHPNEFAEMTAHFLRTEDKRKHA